MKITQIPNLKHIKFNVTYILTTVRLCSFFLLNKFSKHYCQYNGRTVCVNQKQKQTNNLKYLFTHYCDLDCD